MIATADALRPAGPDGALTKAVVWSAAGHAGLVAAVAVTAALRPTPVAEPIRDTVVEVKILRLGRKTEGLPRLSSAPPAAQAPKSLAQDPSVTPVPTTPAPQSAPVDLMAAIAQIKAQADREGPADLGTGDPLGDPFGNAMDAGSQQKYLFAIQQAVRGQWQVPTVISATDLLHLQATVILKLDAKGRVMGHHLESPSGNDLFDSSLIAAIQRAAPFPPPPPELRGMLASTGIGCRFKR